MYVLVTIHSITSAGEYYDDFVLCCGNFLLKTSDILHLGNVLPVAMTIGVVAMLNLSLP